MVDIALTGKSPSENVLKLIYDISAVNWSRGKHVEIYRLVKEITDQVSANLTPYTPQVKSYQLPIKVVEKEFDLLDQKIVDNKFSACDVDLKILLENAKG